MKRDQELREARKRGGSGPSSSAAATSSADVRPSALGSSQLSVQPSKSGAPSSLLDTPAQSFVSVRLHGFHLLAIDFPLSLQGGFSSSAPAVSMGLSVPVVPLERGHHDTGDPNTTNIYVGNLTQEVRCSTSLSLSWLGESSESFVCSMRR